MPYQNRVDPFGQLVATPSRGALMGNRGCLHDTGDRPLRQYQGRRWIICVLDFKNRTREPMPPGRYTSLFFLDEATALAAGHRPCAECQRQRFNAFRAHWAAANPALAGCAAPLVGTLDAALHRERIGDQRGTAKRSYAERLGALPNGVIVVPAHTISPHLVWDDALYPWSFAGYGPPIARADASVQVLTPPSTVRAIAHGYAPAVALAQAR